jgi:hypothetical protein
VDLLLQVSLSRLLVHLAPCCLLFTALVAGDLLEAARPEPDANTGLNRQPEQTV